MRKVLFTRLIFPCLGFLLFFFTPLASAETTLSVSLSANPTSGNVPLTNVSLTAVVSGTATGDIKYKFDCNNDGAYEGVYTTALNPFTASNICNYSYVGSYVARVTAERNGLTSSATQVLNVFPASVTGTLFVTLSSNPVSGVAPLYNVSLTANVSGSASGSISYAFDCTDNGIFERTFTSSQTTFDVPGACGFYLPGNYTARVRVSRGGLTAENTASIIVNAQTSVSSPSLSVFLTANPSSGSAPLNGVSLTASVVGTATGDVTYRFDCLNDGVYEVVSTSSLTAYTAVSACNYSSQGTYLARVRAERGGYAVENTTNIYVSTTYNNPPVANAGSYKDVFQKNSVVLDGSGYSPLGLPVTYYWSCSGGALSNPLIVNPTLYAPAVSSDTSYLCTLIVSDSRNISSMDSMIVNVKTSLYTYPPYTNQTFSVSKTVQNLSDGTAFLDTVSAAPNDVLTFSIEIVAGQNYVNNIILKDNLPSYLSYLGDLRIDNNLILGDISYLNIGSMYQGQRKVVTYKAMVKGNDSFSFGTTPVINTALVLSDNYSNSDSATVNVLKRGVLGATTVSTGISSNILKNILLPLGLAAILVFIFRNKIVFLEEIIDRRKERIQDYKTNKDLKKRIIEIKEKEGGILS